MRRTASIATCCALILLLGVTEAIAAGAFPPPVGSKNTGPAVNGTIVIGAAASSSQGTFAIRLVKGTLQSGTVVHSSRVLGFGPGCTTDPAFISNWFLGGPSIPGGLLSPYFSDGSNLNVLIEIFTELGITIATGVVEPVITDVNNAKCSPAPGTTGTLSLDVTIQFAVPK